LDHLASVALHDRPSRDLKVRQDLVGPPPSNKLDGGVVHLSKKQCQGWRPRECPIRVAEAWNAAVTAVLGTRRQRCCSSTEQRGVSAGAPRD
jgi:hypothetical protein